MAQHVVLAGGSGFLGRRLADELVHCGYRVVILSRTARPAAEECGRGALTPRATRPGEGTPPTGDEPGAITFLRWDGATPGDWVQSLEGAAAVVNLTGRSVNCIHTPENRRKILASRLNSVRVLDDAIGCCAQPPAALVQAGSLAIYGDAGDRVCDEQAPHAQDFSADVCEQWEAAFASGRTPQTRRVLLRVGLALGRGGGALQPLAKLARCFLGGTVGNGRQYLSWLHVDDLNEMFIQAIERPEIAGTYNATGPAPVTNAEFMRELRRAVGRPWSPPAPAWAVRFGAHWIMRTDADLALTGRRCVPRRWLEQGFEFRFNELAAALRDLI